MSLQKRSLDDDATEAGDSPPAISRQRTVSPAPMAAGPITDEGKKVALCYNKAVWEYCHPEIAPPLIERAGRIFKSAVQGDTIEVLSISEYFARDQPGDTKLIVDSSEEEIAATVKTSTDEVSTTQDSDKGAVQQSKIDKEQAGKAPKYKIRIKEEKIGPAVSFVLERLFRFIEISPHDPAGLLLNFAERWPCKANPTISVESDEEDSEDEFEPEEGRREDDIESTDEDNGEDDSDNSDGEGSDIDGEVSNDGNEGDCTEKAADRLRIKHEKNEAWLLTWSKFTSTDGLEEEDGPDALLSCLDFALHYLEMQTRGDEDEEMVDDFLTYHYGAGYYLYIGLMILQLCYAISPHSLIGIVVLCLMDFTPSLIGEMTPAEHTAFLAVMMPAIGDGPGSVFRFVPQHLADVVDVIVGSIIPGLE